MLDHILLTNSISSTCGATSKVVGAESLDRVEMACLENVCVQRKLTWPLGAMPLRVSDFHFPLDTSIFHSTTSIFHFPTSKADPVAFTGTDNV